jgi:protein-tyrosine phosphatase
VLRAKAPGWQIDSAGTAAWHVGKPPYGPMQDAAREAGYDMSGLRARQLAGPDYDAFDLIVGMDADNLTEITGRAPAGHSAAICCLTDYVEDADHVPDPYYTRDFEGALALIERCTDALIAAKGKAT